MPVKRRFNFKGLKRLVCWAKRKHVFPETVSYGVRLSSRCERCDIRYMEAFLL